jgi:hypothetical protein
MTSTDGLVWRKVSTVLGGNLWALTMAGDRLIATVSAGNAYDGPYVVWQSTDAGSTWQPLPGPDGSQLRLRATGDGTSVRVSDDTGKVNWVGTLSTP